MMRQILRHDIERANVEAFAEARNWFLAHSDDLPIGWRTHEPRGFGTRRGRDGTFGLYLQPWQFKSVLENM